MFIRFNYKYISLLSMLVLLQCELTSSNALRVLNSFPAAIYIEGYTADDTADYDASDGYVAGINLTQVLTLSKMEPGETSVNLNFDKKPGTTNRTLIFILGQNINGVITFMDDVVFTDFDLTKKLVITAGGDIEYQ